PILFYWEMTHFRPRTQGLEFAARSEKKKPPNMWRFQMHLSESTSYASNRLIHLLSEALLYFFHKVYRDISQSGNFSNGMTGHCKQVYYKFSHSLFHIEFFQNIHNAFLFEAIGSTE